MSRRCSKAENLPYAHLDGDMSYFPWLTLTSPLRTSYTGLYEACVTQQNVSPLASRTLSWGLFWQLQYGTMQCRCDMNFSFCVSPSPSCAFTCWTPYPTSGTASSNSLRQLASQTALIGTGLTIAPLIHLWKLRYTSRKSNPALTRSTDNFHRFG